VDFRPDDPPGRPKKRPSATDGAIESANLRGTRTLIVSVSARAAAQSAVRGGFQPIAIDAFADADLQACCAVTAATPFPDGVAAAAGGVEAEEWMYGGPLENRPDLVRALSQGRTLLGCDAETLQRVRSPLNLAAVLEAAGIPHLEVRDQPPPSHTGRWLFKPVASGGGRKIWRWPSPQGRAAIERGQHVYWQAFAPGRSYAAAFVADGVDCALLGVTRQLIGRTWGAAGRYEYCGSLGPLQASPVAKSELARLGQVLTRAFELRGLFGIDLVRRDNQFVTVEVNPRYTASMELFDWAWGESLVALHGAACREKLPAIHQRRTAGYFGKLFVFAPRACVAPSGLWNELREPFAAPGWPAFGDVPVDRAPIPAGGPIATVFACSQSLPALRQALRERALWLRERLGVG